MDWFDAQSPKHVLRRLNLRKVNSLTAELRPIVKTIFWHTHARIVNEPMGKATFICSALDIGRAYWLQIHIAWEKCTRGLLRLSVLIDIVAIPDGDCDLAARHTVH